MDALIQAMEAKDPARVAACCHPDVVLRSPISRRVVFRGRETVRELLGVVYGEVGPVAVHEVVGDGDVRALLVASSVRGVPLDEVMVVRLGDDGLVHSWTLYVRAMPQLVAFAAALAPPLARRRSRARALALRLMLTPLAAFVRAGEPAVVALTGAGEPAPDASGP